MHCNQVRVWGGGRETPDFFVPDCDGDLVWEGRWGRRGEEGGGVCSMALAEKRCCVLFRCCLYYPTV